MPLKLIAIGCIHGDLKKNLLDFIVSEKPDAVLASGDFSGGDFDEKLRKYEKDLVDKFGPISEFWPLKVQIDSEKNFQKWAKISAQNTEKVFHELKKIKVPIFYIHGNWDSVSMDMRGAFEGSGAFFIDEQEGKNMSFIHNRVVRMKDFDVVGFGGYRGTSTKEYLYKDLPEPRPDPRYITGIRDGMMRHLDKLFARVRNKRKTILLTHDPPYKVLDYLAQAQKNYGEKVTRDIIKKHKPMLCVCSHFHEHQGVAKIKKTVVVNSGYGKNGQCALIEIGDKVKVKLVKL